MRGSIRKSLWALLCFLLTFSFFWIAASHFHTSIPGSEDSAIFYSTDTFDDLQLLHAHAIDEAKSSVLLIIYALNDPQVLASLRKKADEGVKVEVLCDAEASKGVAKKLNSKVTLFLKKGKHLMHQKILSIDEKKVWIGSANMTTASLKTHSNLVTGFHSPELAKSIRDRFLSMQTPSKKNETPELLSIGNQSVELWFFPENTEGVDKIRNLIRTAKKSIRVAMFTWTREDLTKELIAAHRRGVKVKAVIDKDSANGVSRKIYAILKTSGVPVIVNQGDGLLHHKFLIVDDAILVNGSTNWTYPGFSGNQECSTVIYDLNPKQQKFLNQMWKQILKNSQKKP